MSPQSLSVWLMLSAWAVVSHGSRALAADEDVRAAFLREYEPHAKELQRFYAHGEARCVDTQLFPNGKKSVQRYKIKWSGPNFLLTADEDVPGDAEKTAPKNLRTIIGGNSRYEFSLDPKGEGRYAITKLTMSRHDKPTGYSYPCAPVADYLYSARTFLEMGADPNIHFLEFQDDVWQGNPAKKLKIRLKHNYGSDPRKTTEKVVAFYFSPADRWVCQGTQGQEVTALDGRREERYFYDTKGSQRFPTLKRWEWWVTDKKDPSKLVTVVVRDITEFRPHVPFPQSDFTLTAFGLPEPLGVVWEKPTRWYLWFIGMAVVLLTLGWYFRSRVQRRATIVAPHPAPRD